MLAQKTDQQLMQLIGKADQQAFAELVKRHTDRYYQLAFYTLKNKSDADDVMQAVFIKLWQNPSMWNAKKSKFTTWFYRVVFNACHDLIRKQNGYTQLEKTIKTEQEHGNVTYLSQQVVGDEEGRLSENQQQAHQQQSLEYAISQLPPAQRDAINLVVYSGLPQKQAADVMSVSVKALESMLGRAKKTMADSANQYLQNLQTRQITPAQIVSSQNKAYER